MIVTKRNVVTAVESSEWLNTVKYQALGCILNDVGIDKSDTSVTLYINFSNQSCLQFNNCDGASFYFSDTGFVISLYSDVGYQERYGTNLTNYSANNRARIDEVNKKLIQSTARLRYIELIEKDQAIKLVFTVKKSGSMSDLEVRIFSPMFADFVVPNYSISGT